MSRLARLLLHKRRLAGILVVAVTVAALAGLPRLAFDDDYRRVFRSASAAYRLAEEVAAQFFADEQEVVVLLEGGAASRAEGLEALRETTLELLALPDVVDVLSALAAFPLGPPSPGEVVTHPLLSGRLVSEDGEAALLLVQLRPEMSVDELEPALAAIRERTTIAAAPAGLTVTVTGTPVLRAEIVRGVQGDQVRFTTIGMVATALVALLLFRRVAALVIVGLPPLVGMLWTLGALAWCGEPLNVISNVLPLLVLAIGLTDSVHLLHRTLRLRAGGAAREAAAAGALGDVGAACALAALTTACGLASLALVPIELVRRFGLAGAAGVALGFVAVVTLTPLLAASPLLERARRRPVRAPRGPSATTLASLLARPLARPLPVALAAVALTLALGAALPGLRADYRYGKYLPDEGETARALRHVEARFGGALPLHVLVEWPRRGELTSAAALAISEAEQAMAANALFRRPLSVLELLRPLGDPGEAPTGLVSLLPLAAGPVERLVRPDLGRALVTARVPDVGAARLRAAFDALDHELAVIERRHPGVRLRRTGLLALSADASLEMIGALGRSVVLAAVLVSAVLLLLLRSPLLGVASLVPNVLPLAAVGACLAASGRPLQYTSLTVFSLCLGLAVDDTIHLVMAWRRRRSRGVEARAAMRGALEETAPALVTTTALLLVAFGALLASALPLIRLFGALCCLALAVALVGDLVLLPSLLLVGERRWWMPRSAAGPSAAPYAAVSTTHLDGRPHPTARRESRRRADPESGRN